MTENMKNLDEEIAQQIKNDHIKKMVFTARNYSLEDVETIVCGNLNTIAHEYEKALSALRASWEKEKQELYKHVKMWKDQVQIVNDDFQQDVDKLEAEKQALEAEKKGLEAKYETLLCQDSFKALRELKEEITSLKAENERLRMAFKIVEDANG